MPYLKTPRPLTQAEIDQEVQSIKATLEGLGPNGQDYVWDRIYKDLKDMNLTKEDHQTILKAASKNEDGFN